MIIWPFLSAIIVGAILVPGPMRGHVQAFDFLPTVLVVPPARACIRSPAVMDQHHRQNRQHDRETCKRYRQSH